MELRRHRAPLIAVGTAVAVCAVVIVLGVSVGAVPFAFSIVYSQLIHPDISTQAGRILWDIRIPRVAIAALVGAALGMAGMLLQTMLRNPLVDPYLTGTSAGAACAIAVGIAAGITASLLPLLAFGAALATALLVAALARTGAGLSHERLILGRHLAFGALRRGRDPGDLAFAAREHVAEHPCLAGWQLGRARLG